MEYHVRKLIRDLGIEDEQEKEALLRTVRKLLDEKPKEDSPDKKELKERKRKEVSRRIEASRGRNTRPLALLAGIEAELAEHSAALAKLSESDAMFAKPHGEAAGTSTSKDFAALLKAYLREKRPDTNLLVHQLTRLIPPRAVYGQHQAQRLRSDVIALCASMGSKNPLESILDRLIVGVEVATFDCLDRAAQTFDQRALDVNLRHGLKGANIIMNLLRERRAQVSQVSLSERSRYSLVNPSMAACKTDL